MTNRLTKLERNALRIAQKGDITSVLKGIEFHQAFLLLKQIRGHLITKHYEPAADKATLGILKIAVRCNNRALDFLDLVYSAYIEAQANELGVNLPGEEVFRKVMKASKEKVYKSALDIIVYGCILPEK